MTTRPAVAGSVTVGVDLAAAPAGTAVATLSWQQDGPARRAVVTALVVGADDATVLTALRSGAAKVGIDCPVGWPSGFVDVVTDHHHDELRADLADRPGWRQPLVNRVTDLRVRELTTLVPLSVAADRIGHTALRCAALLAQARVRGVDVARDGSGAVAEVYPAAALRTWGLPYRRYKGVAHAPARDALVTALLAAAPWLDPGTHEGTMRSSDHALDAVVCAVVARAVVLGLTDPPTTRLAAREGWIHVPTAPLAALVAA